jgi:spore maturation protein CgeB
MAAALLSNHFDFALYSTCKDERLTNVRMHDYVDYYSVMPKVFAASLVNLNISLRTIRTGIPLRIIDILGCGGFVISNFQEEIAEYFVPGQDLEIYENLEDLFAKTKFYLEHDDARRQIAQNGFEKVQRDFTFQDRLSRMISGATL